MGHCPEMLISSPVVDALFFFVATRTDTITRRLQCVAIIRTATHHLLITVFERPTPVRSRLSARQQSQSSPDPAGKDSATSSPIFTEAGTSVRLSFQSRSLLLLLADESSGVTVRMKHFRYFNLLAAGW